MGQLCRRVPTPPRCVAASAVSFDSARHQVRALLLFTLVHSHGRSPPSTCGGADPASSAVAGVGSVNPDGWRRVEPLGGLALGHARRADGAGADAGPARARARVGPRQQEARRLQGLRAGVGERRDAACTVRHNGGLCTVGCTCGASAPQGHSTLSGSASMRLLAGAT